MISFSELYESLQHKFLAWRLIDKLKIFLQCFYFYLAFIGIFGFSLFIAEEQMQINMWSIFAASDVNRTDLILKNCKVIESTNEVSKIINKYFMWLNPWQRWSYAALNDGVDVYLETQRAYVLATSPELFIGKEIKLDFKYKSYTPGKNNLFTLKNKKVKIITNKMPNNSVIHVTGIVQPDPTVAGGVIIINNN